MGVIKMNSDRLIEELFGFHLPVRFDVKAVESCQDFARISEIYEDDGEIIIVLH